MEGKNFLKSFLPLMLRNNEGLAISCAEKLKALVGTKASSGLMPDALMNAQRQGGANPAHTAAGRLEQALRLELNS